ncbi:uncharacterized protein LOC109610617 [Camponotus floridanus]|uniref:uncharacterized protein LOC109610617 n=1 Tax=Camponotus floridanus TaxID=104421 RepID=UPI000DC6C303|nr:uncharacterized protein LOC109610617 [Camponotus floridanus]
MAQRYTAIIIAICIGMITVVGTGTTLLTILAHICGMFTIVSYRIEQAMTINNLQNKSKNENVICKGIIYAVDIHCKAIEFSRYLTSSIQGSYFLLIGIGVLSLSLNLFEMYQILSGDGDKEAFFIHFLFIFIILLYMFVTSYVGQEIIDHNNDIYYTAYNVCWYVAPLHIQKLILFLLQRGSKVVNLNVGGLIAASLNCFASLASASVSYFTFIYSTHE